MKAVAYREPGAIERPDALIDIDLPEPGPNGRDLLVEIKAVAVNPVDTKIRKNAAPTDSEYKVIGWDAAGVVRAVGSEASLFKPGDEVYYAGAINRAGTNSELHLVDERIVGRKPASLSFAEAAALPLTSITAWELLFDRLQIGEKNPEDTRLLVVGAAGGVGSILVQLARKLSDATVIGTASRPETQRWVTDLGAHSVIDHSKSLLQELGRIGVQKVTHVASLTHTDQHYSQLVEALAPQGRFALIDDPAQPLDVSALKRKSLSLHWEFMFTRSLFETPDILEQHRLLNRVADLVDDGTLRTTLAQNLGAINADNLKRAHALLESGRAMGKIVLEGF